MNLLDAFTCSVEQTCRGHSAQINSVSFSADSSLIASGSKDLSICLCISKSGSCIHILHGLRVNRSAPVGDPDLYLWVYILLKLKPRSV